MKTNLKVELQNALIYTKEAIARVLGVVVKRVRRTMLWATGFWIWIEGKRPRLYKRSLFTDNFVDFRKRNAREYNVKHIPNGGYNATELYTVTRKAEAHLPKSGFTAGYSVRSALVDGIPIYACGCLDYVESAKAFKAPACKHIYAVLFTQGFDSLKAARDAAVMAAAADAKAAIGL